MDIENGQLIRACHGPLLTQGFEARGEDTRSSIRTETVKAITCCGDLVLTVPDQSASTVTVPC